MCLSFVLHNTGPYNDSKIRYKVVRVSPNCGDLRSAHVSYTWKVGKNNIAKRSIDRPHDSAENIGFHCLLTKADAMLGVRGFVNDEKVIIKLEVRGFVAAGEWEAKLGNFKVEYPQTTLLSETWKQAKILQVISRGGRDITHRFVSNK